MHQILDNDHIVGARAEDVQKIKSIENPKPSFHSLRDLLVGTQAGELQPERRAIVFVTKRELVIDAWKKLIDNQVLSLPIYDNKVSHYVGFIDIIDMLDVVVNHFTEHEITATNESDIPNLLRSRSVFASMTVSEAISANVSGGARESYCPVETRMPVMEAIRLMINWRTHRLPVVDGSGSLITILSQSRIVSFLQKHIDLFAYANKPIGELEGLVTKHVYSVTSSQKAIDAFKLIKDKGVNGVAVIDEQGVLKGNISASDLKVIGYTMRILLRLFLPASDFLELIPPNPELPGMICVNSRTTFEELLSKFALCKVHRIYLVNQETGGPDGIVTLTDVLRYVSQHAEQH